MKRQIVYPGAVPLETDLLNTNKNAMIALGHILTDMLGTSTLFSGLGCVPTSPAGMTVNVNPGRAYSLQSTDAGAYSSLVADATPLMKQGILLAAQNFACPAPTTAGFSVNYLIQAAFQEVDGGSTVLPYYNAANPAQAYNGPNGNGTSNTTYRDNTVQLQLKAGVAATTGTQTTPTVDSGFTGLWVITVAFGQVTITSTSIAQYAGAPFLPASLLQMIQQGSSTYAVATGTANAHVAAFSPPLTARVDGMVLRYKAPAANTGALTFNDGLGAVAVVGAAHSALQGGETAANGDVWVQWNTSLSGGSYVLLDSTGGALQVAPATASQHAVQFGQLQFSGGTLAVDSGAANAYVVTTTPSFSTLTIGQKVRFNATNANTGASTINVNGTGVFPLRGQNNSALQGGEIVANGYYEIEYISASVWCITSQAAFNGSMQVANATQSQHAVAYGQVFGVGQAYSNLLGSRALGTSYANSTTKPIFVFIQCSSTAANASLLATVGGTTQIASGATNTAGQPIFLCFPVLPGQSYVVQVNAGTGTIGNWTELR